MPLAGRPLHALGMWRCSKCVYSMLAICLPPVPMCSKVLCPVTHEGCTCMRVSLQYSTHLPTADAHHEHRVAIA